MMPPQYAMPHTAQSFVPPHTMAMPQAAMAMPPQMHAMREWDVRHAGVAVDVNGDGIPDAVVGGGYARPMVQPMVQPVMQPMVQMQTMPQSMPQMMMGPVQPQMMMGPVHPLVERFDIEFSLIFQQNEQTL